jgi:hypothetical protein
MTMQIVTNEHLENQLLRDSWLEVYDNLVAQVDFAYV